MTLATNFEALSLANHDFSNSLYTELAKRENGNIFYSPFSIHLIMFLASVGAASKTFDEMMATMHLNETTHSLENYRNLLEELTSDNDKLILATGMFVDKTFNVATSFENDSKYLKSSMEKLNFKKNSEEQRQYLNDWVLNKTNHKIKDIFPQGSISNDTVLVLANAMHFKSDWMYKFQDAQDEPFYLTSGDNVTVKMMNLVHVLKYYHDNDLKYAALELPYENNDFKMIVLLPDAKDGLKNLEDNLSKIELYEISKEMSRYRVTVKLPRFKTEQSIELKETLSNLGCSKMFTNEANFTNIDPKNRIYVSQVAHKVYVDVNEQGTEAAAATGMMFSTKSSPAQPPPKVNFTADHPFIISIVSRSDIVLFTGRLLNP